MHTRTAVPALFIAASATGALADITVMQVPATYQVEPDFQRCAVSADGRTLMLNASSDSPTSGYRVLVWDVGGGITEVQAPGGSGNAFATSSSLSSVGDRVAFSDTVNGHWAAVLWDRATGYTTLGEPITVQATEGRAGGISRNGLWVCGGRFGWVQQLPTGAGDPPPAFLWPSYPQAPCEIALSWMANDGQVVAGSGDLLSNEISYWGYPPPAPPHLPAIVYSTRADWYANTFTADGVAAGYAIVNGQSRAMLGSPTLRLLLPGASADPAATHEVIAAAVGRSAAVGDTVLTNYAPVFWYWNPTIGTVPLSRVIDPLPDGLQISAVLAMTDDGRKVVGFSQSPYTVYPPQQSIWIASINSPGCGSADFNGDGDAGTDADIEDFFTCLAGNCCFMCVNADFNADGEPGTDADIEAFFRVLAGGGC